MTKRFLLLVVSVLSVVGVSAQTDLPDSCAVALPNLLASDFLKDNDIQAFLKSSNWGQDNTTKKYWVVYSDRAYNTTYKTPSDNAEKYDELTFNEEVRIAQIKDGYALVYVEQFTAAIYPKINKPVRKGWVPMTHLLLWDRCPADEKGIYHKVLPLLNVDEYMKAKINGTEKDLGNIFDNPIVKSGSRKFKAAMEFYFVMKEDKDSGMALLSKGTSLIGKNSQVLYGWVNKASYVLLNNRIFLEPNWDPEVVENLRDKEIKVYENGNAILHVTLGKENNLGQEATKYRMPPNKMRYPLLENKSGKNNQYCIIAFPFSVSNEQEESAIAVKGFTDKKDPQTGYDYWQPVIFISNIEYNDMMTKLQPVMAAAEEGSEDRRPYVKALKELVRVLYGNIDEKEMMSMDIKKVMSLVAGLSVKPESLDGRTLNDIMDRKVVSKDEFSYMIKNFKMKFNKLDRMKNGYKYSIKINGETWYWIPVQDLP